MYNIIVTCTVIVKIIVLFAHVVARLVVFVVYKFSKVFCVFIIIYISSSFSWSRFHQKEEATPDKDMQQKDEEENNDDELECLGNETDDLADANDQAGEDFESEPTNNSSTMEDLSEEDKLKMFEKRILYLLLTLQTAFYTSEAAIGFVVTSLMELFLAISKLNLV